MFIETGTLGLDALEGRVAIVSGAGRGIRYEAARALIWLGARVVVAELDKAAGRQAAARLVSQFGDGTAVFVHTDVGSERSVARLRRRVMSSFGEADVVINNATITPMGSVMEVPINDGDESYQVNLRGPVLLARAFLSSMLERDSGVFMCVSSVGEAFMEAYETFKAAQVHLASTLDAELEGSGVHVLTVDPGLVRTPGLQSAVHSLAPLYGKSVEAFYALSAEHELTAEAAGAGFAAAVARAGRFRGQEISSKQALLAAGIDLSYSASAGEVQPLRPRQARGALELGERVRDTREEQSQGWSERSLFERQWMLGDFKRNAGMPVERWLGALDQLEAILRDEDRQSLHRLELPIGRLAGYYVHMQELAQGYEKDAQKLEAQLAIIRSWQDDAERLGRAVLAVRSPGDAGFKGIAPGDRL